MIGDGPHRGHLERQVRELGLERRVVFTGHRDDAVQILGAADIFVHPTLQDVFPTSIIEAMACGRPVVASRTGGVPELVDDEVTGTLVQPGEASVLASAIAAYVADPQRREHHGAPGRARYDAHFTLSRQVDRLEDLYRRVGRWS